MYGMHTLLAANIHSTFGRNEERDYKKRKRKNKNRYLNQIKNLKYCRNGICHVQIVRTYSMYLVHAKCTHVCIMCMNAF